MIRRFDENIVIGALSGGIVSVLSEAVQRNVIAEAGGLASVVFALGYALYSKYKNKEQTDFEQIWENNRERIVKLFLSAVDYEFIIMNKIFEKLTLEGFDFSIEYSKITSENLKDIDYNGVKERFDQLQPFENIHEFITYEQYVAVYDYLRFSVMFIDLLYKQKYQRDLLESRVQQAKQILKFFSGEVNNYQALKEWKKGNY